jgi:hypothetical protein
MRYKKSVPREQEADKGRERFTNQHVKHGLNCRKVIRVQSNTPPLRSRAKCCVQNRQHPTPAGLECGVGPIRTSKDDDNRELPVLYNIEIGADGIGGREVVHKQDSP